MSGELLPRNSQTRALYELGGGNIFQIHNLPHIKEGIGVVGSGYGIIGTATRLRAGCETIIYFRGGVSGVVTPFSHVTSQRAEGSGVHM